MVEPHKHIGGLSHNRDEKIRERKVFLSKYEKQEPDIWLFLVELYFHYKNKIDQKIKELGFGSVVRNTKLKWTK